MPKEHINPNALAAPRGYSHLVHVTGGTLVYVAGQVAFDAGGKVVGAGDIGAQARQAFGNLRAALAKVGAGPEHIAKINTYVVGYSPEMLTPIGAASREVLGYDPPPAATLVGVEALADPSLLIEVECVAVVG